MRTSADFRWLPTLGVVVCRRCGQTCQRRPNRARRTALDDRLLAHPALDTEAAALVAAYDAAVDAALSFDGR